MSNGMSLIEAKEILTGITNNPRSCLYSQRTAIQTVLDALATAGTLPKIAIDYSKAGSGEAPFDGQYVYGILPDGQHLFRVHWVQDEGQWRSKEGGRYKPVWFSHYTPMPEFEVKGGK